MRGRLAFALATCVCLPLLAADNAPTPGKQEQQQFEKQITIKLDYLLYLPDGYDKDQDKKWPLIVFLHGSGESADARGVNGNVNAVTKHGPPEFLAKGTDLPVKNFIVVSPQCPSQRVGWQPETLNPFLDEIEAKYRVDKDHIYLTGLSMGGYGTWAWASRFPQRFAAIAPMSGGGEPRRAARALAHMPIWDFHGEADPVVPVSQSEEMVEAIQKAGNTEVKFTKYPGVGHDCWSQAYGNPELYEWFLQHKRGPRGRRQR